MQRIGILGGTFDPIHHGHLVAAQEVHERLALDLVLFVPAGNPPHKPARPISAADHRLRMVELAIAGDPRFAVSRVDVDRFGPCYTVETLELLHTEWGPETRLHFIVGSDLLAEITTWRQPQRLIELSELAVVQRPGVEIDLARLEEQLPGLAAHIRWVQMPRMEISSSDLRARVRAGRPISYLTPPAVEAYIRQHKLYH